MAEDFLVVVLVEDTPEEEARRADGEHNNHKGKSVSKIDEALSLFYNVCVLPFDGVHR